MLALCLLAGLTGVINMILWGLYGDLLVEKFDYRKVLRSILFGLFFSTFIYLENPNQPLFMVALITISLERVTTEIYKALIRKEDQKKYDIPSDFNLKFSQLLKFPVGIFLFGLIMYFYWQAELNIHYILLAGLMGLIAAIAGASKDAPYEGFNPKKFFRSPIVSLFVGVILTLLYPGIAGIYFFFAVFGGERIISEFYKKIYKGKIPGKFKSSLKRNTVWENSRWQLLFFYVCDLIMLIALIVLK